ncbi:MAG: serine/threonine protein kinase [Planctomycetota bacterium]
MNINRLGPYEILGVLGRGGMGTVYRAKHFDTGELVALKALSHNYTEDEHFRQRFESEINALLKLDHPNIVRLIGYGQDEGVLYFAMELVEGKSLFHLQREFRTFDWRDVLVIAKDVAAGLRHAHDRGIIHRDLKPGNLLKAPSGAIKVTDFGIAKSFGQDNNTRDNVVGTIDFMSPEQALGKPVTVRSDLYSLGVVLYTLLAGQPPFNSNSIEQSLRNLTTVPPPKIRQVVPNVPEQLEQLIDELLQKRPERRTPTALALLRKLEQIEAELRDYSEAKTTHGRPSSPATPSPPGVKPPTATPPVARQETFRLGAPEDLLNRQTGDLNKTSRRGQDDTGASPQRAVTNAKAETVALNENYELEPEIEKPKRSDYFARVTEQQRKQHATPVVEDKPSSSGFWLLLLAFAAVLSLAVAGTYYALKPPTADQLYTTINFGADRPEQLSNELAQFLKLYPDDPRAARVSEIRDQGEAIKKFRQLALRRNLPKSNLTPLERDFIDVVDDALNDPAAGYSRLEAFVTLHSAQPNANANAAELVALAKTLGAKIKSDASRKELWDRQRIQQLLQRAQSSPDEAADIYRSIITLYESQDWAREEVETARKRLTGN